VKHENGIYMPGEVVILWCERQGGRPTAEGALTAFAQAMPESYRNEDVVRAYRAYYAGEKRVMASWKAPSAPPVWWSKCGP